MASRDELLNDPEAAQRAILDGRQALIWTALPAIVTKVDFTKMTCEVKAAIQAPINKEDGTTEYVELPPLVDVPLVFPSGGGFTITFPVAVDDEVLVVFSSRAIDAWWQSGGVQLPVETRMHDLSDAFAIPGPKSQATKISNVSSSKMQIRNNDGDVYVEIAANGKITLKSETGVEVQGNLKVTGTVNADGNVASGGDISATGNIGTTLGDVNAGLISLKLHKHLSAAPGNPTGPAIP